MLRDQASIDIERAPLHLYEPTRPNSVLSCIKTGLKLSTSCIGWVLANATTSAAAGAIGAGVLTTTHHEGHVALESAEIAALGCATLSGILAPCCFFPSFNSPKENAMNAICFLACVYLFQQTLGSLLGYAMLMKLVDLDMSIGQVVADVAIGTAILLIPLITLICCLTPYCTNLWSSSKEQHHAIELR